MKHKHRLTAKQLAAIRAQMEGCPFCGSQDVHAVENDYLVMKFQCDECLAEVSFDACGERTVGDNVARWNRRDYFKKLDEIAVAQQLLEIPEKSKLHYATMEDFKCSAWGPDCKECPERKECEHHA